MFAVLGMCRFHKGFSRIAGWLVTTRHQFLCLPQKAIKENEEFSTQECSHPVSCSSSLLAGVYFGCSWPRVAEEINPCTSWRRCLEPERCSPDLSEPPLCLVYFTACLGQVQPMEHRDISLSIHKRFFLPLALPRQP